MKNIDGEHQESPPDHPAHTVNTGGGPYIAGDVNIDGDFVDKGQSESKRKPVKSSRPPSQRKEKPKIKVEIKAAWIGVAGVILATVLAFILDKTPPFTFPTRQTPTPACPYAASIDTETLINLINAEGDAVVKEDIENIKIIFALNVVIRDEASGETWTDPTVRYSTLFKNATYVVAQHFEFKPAGPGIDGNRAYFTSGSEGKYYALNKTLQSYYSPSGSDHWTFEKMNGCWVITRFSFNARDVSFPQ